MRKNRGKKIVSIIAILAALLVMGVNCYAHSGRKDSSGGHRDDENKSGLGYYHYHCGGHPAHLHSNGICPYSSKEKTSTKKTTTKKTTNTKKTYTTNNKSSAITTSSKPATSKTINVSSIKISSDREEIEVGDIEQLKVNISPNNASNKKITWKSSNEEIATVNSQGIVKANSPGKVKIVATSTNNIKDEIEIKIENKEIIDTQNMLNTQNNSATNARKYTSNTQSNHITNTNKDGKERSNMAAGIITLGLLGGGTYLGYKKFKK